LCYDKNGYYIEPIKHGPRCKYHFDSSGNIVYECNCTNEYKMDSYIGDPPTDEENEYDYSGTYIGLAY